MSAPFGYLEQSKLEDTIQRLQREISHDRWAIADRADYESEILRLTKRREELAARMAEDEEQGA